MNFEVKFLDEVKTFLKIIDEKAKQKLVYNIRKAKRFKDASIFKKLENTEIWEFRARMNKLQYRLFAFWDTNEKALVVCTHGMIKKTQKTPIAEIQKAERIRKEYLNNKEPSNNLEL